MNRCLLIAVLLILWVIPGHAALKTVGQGESLRFDPSGFPPEMKSAYIVMQSRCTQCHSLERTVIAVTTGVAPISGRPFDRAAVSAYGQKMLRKQTVRMSKDEVKVVENLLTYLVDTAQTRKP